MMVIGKESLSFPTKSASKVCAAMDNQANGMISRFMSSVEGWQLRGIQEAIFEGYTSTQIVFETLNLVDSLERQAKGHLRGSIISQKLLGLHSPENGIEIKLSSNSLGSYSFAEITLNNLVRLTVKTNDDPFSLPEESDFRTEHAKDNPEYVGPLLELLREEQHNDALKLSDKKLINGIITHRPKFSGIPEFLHVVFPCKNYREVLGHKDFIECCEQLEANEEQSIIKRRSAPIEPAKTSLRLRKQG